MSRSLRHQPVPPSVIAFLRIVPVEYDETDVRKAWNSRVNGVQFRRGRLRDSKALPEPQCTIVSSSLPRSARPGQPTTVARGGAHSAPSQALRRAPPTGGAGWAAGHARGTARRGLAHGRGQRQRPARDDSRAARPRWETMPRRRASSRPCRIAATASSRPSSPSTRRAPIRRPRSRVASRAAGRRDNVLLIGRDAELARLDEWLRARRERHRGRWCSSPASRGSARPRWSTASSPPSRASTTCGRHADSASSTTDPARHTCPCWRRSDSSAGSPDGEQVIALLGRHAPTWLAQMPGLIGDAELETVQRRAHGATRERMLRELAEALEALTAETTLVLVLEDLHWSDYSTLDLVSLLAQRRTPARLLLLGDLSAGGRDRERASAERDEAGAARARAMRGAAAAIPDRRRSQPVSGGQVSAAAAAAAISARPFTAAPRATRCSSSTSSTIGSRQSVLVETAGQWQLAAPVEDIAAVPDNLRQMIDKQLGRLTPEECRLLEVASVVGGEFSTGGGRGGTGGARRSESKSSCEGLARRDQFLRARGTEVLGGRDGHRPLRFSSRALPAGALRAGRRGAASAPAPPHRRMGRGTPFGTRVAGHAAALAMHFERGQDHPRAIEYLTQAADNAMRRQAPHRGGRSSRQKLGAAEDPTGFPKPHRA